MKTNRLLHNIYILTGFVCVIILGACSTTSNLPDDEVLYDGIKKINIDGNDSSPLGGDAVYEVKATLAYTPNNSFMGSSKYRFPLPIGLWIHNSLATKEDRSKTQEWFFKSFATEPVTISAVNPATRSKVAENTIQNYGYFNGNVDYELVNQKNPKKQKIIYNVHLGEPYMLDSVKYG